MMSAARPIAVSALTLFALGCGEPARSDGAAATDASVSTRDAAASAPASDSTSTLAGSPLAPGVCASTEAVEGGSISVRGIDSTWVALAVGSLDQFAPRDSARAAARLTRLGGTLATDTSVADFRGLPIAVRSLWRVVPSEGDTVFAANLVRRIPIESDPVEEIFTVLASPEMQPGQRDGLRSEWVQRDVGREETVVFRDLVAVWRLPGDTVAVLFAHDDERGVLGQFLVRASRAWSTRWDGLLPGCDATLPR